MSVIREFVAVYGQEAYERLAVRCDSAETLAATCLRAISGPSSATSECTNVAKILSKIVVRWTIEPSKPRGASCTYDAKELGDTLARIRAASRSSIIRANGGDPIAELQYEDGSTEVKEFAIKV